MRADLTLQKIHIRFILLCLLVVYACRAQFINIHINFILLGLLVVYACRAHITKNSDKVYVIVFVGSLCMQNSPYKKFT
jgi:hypothetical protein